ncbi:MAG: release factor glutamine methyltransferase [Candidatus Azotimanducaceae bacterium]|jgi:release factor glutamine methyltransferase
MMAKPATAETVSEILAAAVARLSDGSDSPALDCQLLLAHVTGKDRQWFYAHSEASLTQNDSDEFQSCIDRRCKGEPVAYITGQRAFWDLEFKVTPDTLIPRPETELIVEAALDLTASRIGTVLDLGTGSGAIALSLASARPGWQVTATDVSEQALYIAQRNAMSSINTNKANAVGINNVQFIQSSWFENVTGKFDLIVSNPPYLRDDDPHFESLAFEPRLALAAGKTGLDCLSMIVHQASGYLAPDGILMLEHGFDQRAAVTQLLKTAGFETITPLDDLAGLHRAIIAQCHTVSETDQSLC